MVDALFRLDAPSLTVPSIFVSVIASVTADTAPHVQGKKPPLSPLPPALSHPSPCRITQVSPLLHGIDFLRCVFMYAYLTRLSALLAAGVSCYGVRIGPGCHNRELEPGQEDRDASRPITGSLRPQGGRHLTHM